MIGPNPSEATVQDCLGGAVCQVLGDAIPTKKKSFTSWSMESDFFDLRDYERWSINNFLVVAYQCLEP